jgi:hypothetical protein
LVTAGVKEDIFVADIPYPTQFVKLPVPTSPPRPKSPIDSIIDSTVETESETLSSFKIRNINEKCKSAALLNLVGPINCNHKWCRPCWRGIIYMGQTDEKKAEQLKKAIATSRPEVRQL